MAQNLCVYTATVTGGSNYICDKYNIWMKPTKRPTQKRVVFRIQLTPLAKDSLSELSSRLGITQIRLTSKLVEWFATQPDTIQGMLLGFYAESIRADVAKLLLESPQRGAIEDNNSDKKT